MLRFMKLRAQFFVVLWVWAIIGGITIFAAPANAAPANAAPAKVTAAQAHAVSGGYANTTQTAAQLNSAPPIVVLLTNAIQWDQLDPDLTPHLAQWASTGTMFNIVPPIISGWGCPIDVALAIAAGHQVASESVSSFPTCAMRPIYDGLTLPTWNTITGSDDVRNTLDGAENQLGALGEVLNSSGTDFHAIGSSAASLLVNSEGKVPSNYTSAPPHNDKLAQLVSESVAQYPLTVADVSAANFELDPERNAAASSPLSLLLPSDVTTEYQHNQQIVLPESYRLYQTRRAAARLDTVLEKIKPGTKVYMISLQSLSSSDVMQPGFVSFGGIRHSLELGTHSEEGSSQGSSVSPNDSRIAGETGLAWTPQVRQAGTISYESIAPSLFADLGINATLYDIPAMGSFTAPNIQVDPHSCSGGKSCFTERVEQLTSQSHKATVIRALRGTYIRDLTWIVVVFTLIASVVLYGYVRRDQLAARCRRISAPLLCLSSVLKYRILRITVAGLALWISAIPLATFFSTWLYRWWEKPNPSNALYSSTALIALAVALCALMLRHIHSFAPLYAIGGATALAILTDVVKGSRVLADSPIGFNTLLGARYYGLGNEAFALEATGLLLGLAGCSAILKRMGANRWIIACVTCTVGGIGILIGLWPTFGADFGGAIALLPSVLALAALSAKIHLSVRKVIIAVVSGLVLACGIGVADWLRGSGQRTHLGNFIQMVIDGEAFDIVLRKISVNLRLLVTSSHRWIVLAGLIFLVAVMWAWLGRYSRKYYAEHCETEPTTYRHYDVDTPQSASLDDELYGVTHARSNATTGSSEAAEFTSSDGAGVACVPTATKNYSMYSLPDGANYSWPSTIAYVPIGSMLVAVLLCLTLAFAVNDSGIALPGMGFVLLIPGLIAGVTLSKA